MVAAFVGLGVGKFIPQEDALNVGKKFTKWIRNFERSIRLSGITQYTVPVWYTVRYGTQYGTVQYNATQRNTTQHNTG